jgi:rsbT antagonist protein RsbS
MARVPVVQVQNVLIAVVQDNLVDRDALQLQEDLAALIERGDAVGVLIDLSAVDIVDSFLGRLIYDVTSVLRLLGAETVVVGIQPAVAITLVELGLDMHDVPVALTASKGLAYLRRRLALRQYYG